MLFRINNLRLGCFFLPSQRIKYSTDNCPLLSKLTIPSIPKVIWLYWNVRVSNLQLEFPEYWGKMYDSETIIKIFVGTNITRLLMSFNISQAIPTLAGGGRRWNWKYWVNFWHLKKILVNGYIYLQGGNPAFLRSSFTLLN